MATNSRRHISIVNGTSTGSWHSLSVSERKQYTPSYIVRGSQGFVEEALLGALCKVDLVVCINQGNLSERSQQVQHIGDIYRSAAKVIIFVGDRSEGVEAAMQLLKDIDKNIHFADLFKSVDPSDRLKQVSQLVKLLKRDWFSRLWTV